MNIKDFLIDNYIWILAIILITIITIIGFIADKKKSNKKSEDLIPQQPITPIEPVNNQTITMQPQGEPLNVQEQSNIGMQQNFNNAISTIPTQSPVEQMNQPINPQENMQATLINNINNPMQVENEKEKKETEQPYQPLSEQKPVFAPQPVPNFQSQQPMVDNQKMMPNNNLETPMPSMIMPQQSIPAYNMVPETPIQNNSMVMPNMNINQQPITMQTIPTPSIPQPVMPQSIMQPTQTYNQNSQIQPNMTIPTPVPQPMQQTNQQNQPGAQGTLNFVFGPQNNNQNM